jgi:hypothetical protein
MKQRIQITADVDKRHKTYVEKLAKKRRVTISYVMREILDKVMENTPSV